MLRALERHWPLLVGLAIGAVVLWISAQGFGAY